MDIPSNSCDVSIVSAWLIVFGDVNGDGCGGIDNDGNGDGDGDGDGDISEPEVVVVVGRISGTSQCLVAHKPPL